MRAAKYVFALATATACADASAGVAWLSRANCVAGVVNESVTYDRPELSTHYMYTESDHVGLGSYGRARGLDLARLPSSPGLHIVALGDSPFVGPIAQRMRQEIAEQASVGSYISDSGEVPDLRQATRTAQPALASTSLFGKRYHSLADIRPHLRYTPISLSGTLLESHPMVEATTAGGVSDGRWSGVTRSWDVAGLGFVRLDESEYRETGGSITLVKEWLNSEVNGHPATLKTMRSDDGATLVSISWVTESTDFRLDLQPVHVDAVEANQQTLLKLARSLGG
ncbi:hypothetical protein C8J98_10140 [Luteibacter sp. OK325]|nr:hypothetical protein C8J98_10140 [Luteibacter sp. OK325]